MFQAKIEIKGVIVTEGDYAESLVSAVTDAAQRFRQSGIKTWPEPLVFKVYFTDNGR